MGDEMNEEDPVYVASILSPADPENLKLAFGMMIDKLIENAGVDIIDWSSAEFQSNRVMDGGNLQELIYFQMGVRALRGIPDGIK